MSNSPKLYPQAAADGTPIPDSIANPAGYIVANLSTTPVRIALPNTNNIVSFYATDACVILLKETGNYVSGSYQSGGYILLPGVLYSLYIDADFFRVQQIGSTAGAQLFANVQAPWGGAGQQIERSI